MNSTAYLIAGMSSAINGKMYSNRQITVDGSWQQQFHARGYNAVTSLFETAPAHHDYCRKVHRAVLQTETQLKKVWLSVSRQGKDYEIEFPITMCPVSKFRKVLTELGFTCNHLTA